MFENIKANWLPTLAGVLVAGATLFKSQVENGHIEWPAILQAMLFALLGFAAKQFNVTGGTKLNGDTSATPMAAAGVSAGEEDSAKARGLVDSRFGKNFPPK